MQSSYIFSFLHCMYPFIIFTHPLTLADEKRERSRILLIKSWRAPVLRLSCPSIENPVSSSCTSPTVPTPTLQHQHLLHQSCVLLCPAILELENKRAEALKPEEWGLPDDVERETNWLHDHHTASEGSGLWIVRTDSVSLMSGRALTETWKETASAWHVDNLLSKPGYFCEWWHY